MATGKALVCKLANIQLIEGADRIMQATLFGETVIVSKDYKEGELGLLFDCETQLSHEYVKGNNLYRNSDLNSDKAKTGYFEENRRVRPIKMKGVRCSGLWMPIESLDFTGDHFFDQDNSYIGTQIDANNGVSICQKYITIKTRNSQGVNQKGKARENDCPTFKEHIDTDQALRNLNLFKEGNLVTITEKLHGTSLRVGNLLVNRNKSLFERLLNKIGISTLESEYKFVVGSRRVVKRIGEQEREGVQNYYNQDIWSLASDKCFKEKILKGETVYAEIVGYLSEGTPIMGSQSNEKLKKFMDANQYKAFIEKYGNATVFSYGLPVGEFEVYVYRITMTNEDGESYDITWDQVKNRCDKMGVKYVPEIDRDVVKPSDEDSDYLEWINDITDLDSENFHSNLKEGIIIRIDNGSNTPIFLKNKSYNFKVLENIIKDTEQVDLEESQG
jgi:hypothetical protein